MAKIARRSVASNPSSLTSSHSTIPNLNSIQQQQHIKRSSVTKIENTTLPLLTQNQSIDSDATGHTNVQIINHNSPTIQSTSSDSSNFSIKVNTNNSSTKAKTSASPADNATTATIHRDSGGGVEQFNRTASIDPIAAERERMRMEFYATYDVMTGVRIAATLGGFFGLMVFLIVYKSRSHSNETLKVLKDPKTAALAVACMQEEEDRKIIEAMDATGLSIFPDEYDNMLFRRQRMLSLGNVSAPPVLHRGFRFSSVVLGGGGYSSLLEPPRRSSYSYGGPGSRRKSASESSRILSNYPMGSSFGTDDYFIETDDELDNDYNQLNVNDDVQNQGYLEVPPIGQDTRRSSAMTCCSTESSYLERRCSALTLGLNNLPPSLRQKLESSDKNGQKRSHHGSSSDLWDYYYPDIQVIQATPKTSPCPSERERGLYDKPKYTTTRTASPQDTTTTAGSGVSSITIDSAGSSSYYYRKNSMSAYYDPESLQDKRLASFGDSRDGISYYQQYELPPTGNGDDKQWRRQSRKNKYDDNNELKLIVKRKLSDASSCATTNINNNSLSYILNNNNSSFTEAQAAAIAVIDGTVLAHMQRAVAGNGICGTGIGRAPLASCSSFKISSIDYQDSDLRSMGEDDSIFIESYADTDDDLEQFSTDSDEISLDIDDEDNRDKQSLPPTASSPHKKHELQKLALPVLGGTTTTAQQISIKSEPISIETVVKGRIRPSLERHRTLSVSSSDKIQLDSTYRSSSRGGGKSSTLETHFTCPPISQQELLLKPNLSASNTPLLAFRRSQLQQQYSDPQSLPTTTDEATTNTFETCSTEVPVVINPNEIGFTTKNPIRKTTMTTQMVGGATRKHHDYESPAIKKISTFNYDNNNDSSMSSSCSNSNNKLNKKRFSTSKLKNYRSHHSEGSGIRFVNDNGKNKRGRSSTGDGGIGSSFSSSSINGSPIKNKENVGYNVMIDNKSKNKNIVKTTKRSTTTKGPSVILELPIINLPTGSSRYHDNNDDNSEKDNRSRGICSEGAVRDPSLPGSSRKWSKETLF